MVSQAGRPLWMVADGMGVVLGCVVWLGDLGIEGLFDVAEWFPVEGLNVRVCLIRWLRGCGL